MRTKNKIIFSLSMVLCGVLLILISFAIPKYPKEVPKETAIKTRFTTSLEFSNIKLYTYFKKLNPDKPVDVLLDDLINQKEIYVPSEHLGLVFIDETCDKAFLDAGYDKFLHNDILGFISIVITDRKEAGVVLHIKLALKIGGEIESKVIMDYNPISINILVYAEEAFVYIRDQSKRANIIKALLTGDTVEFFGNLAYNYIYVEKTTKSLIVGGEFSDYVGGSGTGEDIIYGGGGDDCISGRGGKDVIHGEGGNDKIASIYFSTYYIDKASEDKEGDILDGGDGNDEIYGSLNSDVISGGKGNDMLFSGHDLKEDILIGGPGKDTIFKSKGDITDTDKNDVIKELYK